MNKICNRLALAAAFGAFATAAMAQAEPGSYWYNGDFNGVNGLNVSGNLPSAVYDDFNVGASGVNVTGVYMNVLSGDSTLNSFAWEIRSGVSSGNGGTLIASGSGAGATVTKTGRTGFGLTEYTVLVTGLNVNLGSGTYWLGGSIGDPSGTGTLYESTTSGANSVGSPAGNDDNSFFNSSYFGANWQAANLYVGAPADFSEGVIGGAAPEPASMTLLGLGAVALIRRRAKK